MSSRLSQFFKRSKYYLKCPSWKRYLVALRAMMTIWTILVGIILTNWYKKCFTMEMMIPTRYESPWKSVMDIEDIKILLLFNLLDQYESHLYQFIGFTLQSDYFRYQFFFNEILVRSQPLAEEYRGSK